MSASARPALAGVRVLDLAGPSAALAGRILADLGADVILVEPPTGNATRAVAPFLDGEPGPERGFAHLYYGANKRSVVLDPQAVDDAERLRALVRSADVLIETATPGEPLAPGLDDAALAALRPDLIRVSVTPFGLDAEWRLRRANDLVATAAGGLTFVSGARQGPPQHGAGRPAYSMAGLIAASGVMIALRARERDGNGCRLDVSLQEAACMAVLQTACPAAWTYYKLVPGRPGLSTALRCADGGWVAFLTRPDRFEHFMRWNAATQTGVELGPDDWPHARIAAPPQDNPVIAATAELARRLDRDAFDAAAVEAEQMCLPISDFPYLERHPHLLHNRQFLEVDHPVLERPLGFVRSPVDAMAGEIALRAAPELGADTDDVLARVVPRPAAAARAAPDPVNALAGIRVVDFCWVLAGPLGTRILANFGADVIRVESARRRDGIRDTLKPPGLKDDDLGALFNTANTGKRSLALDLSDERARDALRRVIAQADVVTNNFRPGALERMGFGYTELCKLKPDIILLNQPGTHREGAWAPRSTLGNMVMGASGLSMLMGFPDLPPRGLGVAYPDFTTPYLAVTCVLAALRERDRTGRGQELDLSQLSGLISLLGPDWMHYHASGVQPPQSRNRDPDHAPHGIYPTLGDDEWVAIAVAGDSEWSRFCAAIGRPELEDDPRFASHAARKHHEDDLDALVSEWTRTRERFEIADRLQATGIAAAAVANLRDTFERDPQLRHHYQSVRHPAAPDLDIPIDGEAIRFRGHAHALRRAPTLGEHSEPVLRELGGLSDDDYTALVLADLIG